MFSSLFLTFAVLLDLGYAGSGYNKQRKNRVVLPATLLLLLLSIYVPYQTT